MSQHSLTCCFHPKYASKFGAKPKFNLLCGWLENEIGGLTKAIREINHRNLNLALDIENVNNICMMDGRKLWYVISHSGSWQGTPSAKTAETKALIYILKRSIDCHRSWSNNKLNEKLNRLHHDKTPSRKIHDNFSHLLNRTHFCINLKHYRVTVDRKYMPLFRFFLWTFASLPFFVCVCCYCFISLSVVTVDFSPKKKKKTIFTVLLAIKLIAFSFDFELYWFLGH